MNTLYQKINGHFEESLGNYVKIAGVQRESQENYIKLAGKWIPRTAKYVQPVSARASYTNSGDFSPYYAFDRARRLTGVWNGAQWLTNNGIIHARLNCAFNTAGVLKKLITNNCHHNGFNLQYGIKNVKLYGSNSVDGYNNVTYGNTNHLTFLGDIVFAKHKAADAADPQEVVLPDITEAFKYYVFEISTAHGGNYIGMRQIDMYLHN